MLYYLIMIAHSNTIFIYVYHPLKHDNYYDGAYKIWYELVNMTLKFNVDFSYEHYKISSSYSIFISQ